MGALGIDLLAVACIFAYTLLHCLKDSRPIRNKAASIRRFSETLLSNHLTGFVQKLLTGCEKRLRRTDGPFPWGAPNQVIHLLAPRLLLRRVFYAACKPFMA
jgi:hypothetical protein